MRTATVGVADGRTGNPLPRVHSPPTPLVCTTCRAMYGIGSRTATNRVIRGHRRTVHPDDPDRARSVSPAAAPVTAFLAGFARPRAMDIQELIVATTSGSAWGGG